MKSYLRFLGRNKLYTAIMAVGLSVSLAFVIFTAIFAWDIHTKTWIYPDHRNIYSLACHSDYNGPLVMTEFLNEIPEIEEFCGLSYGHIRVVNGEDLSGHIGYAVTDGFFDMFPKKVLAGDISSLKHEGNALITESLAVSMFGGVQEAIGQTLDCKIVGRSTESEVILAVIGVIEDYTYEIFNTEVIVAAETQAGKSLIEYEASTTDQIFVRTSGHITQEELSDKVHDLIRNHFPKWEEYIQMLNKNLFAHRLDDLYVKHQKNGLNGGDLQGILTVMVIISLTLLLSAILNYINLSFAQTSKRSNVLATMRLVGADRKKIILDQLTESLTMTSICTLFAILIAWASVPAVKQLMGLPQLNISLGVSSIIIILLLIVIVGGIAGLAPALMAMSYKPIEVTKGTFRKKRKMIFGKLFICVQNTLAATLLVIACCLEADMKLRANEPMGFNNMNVGIIYANGEKYDAALLSTPYVKSIGKASSQIQAGFWEWLRTADGELIEADVFLCDTTAFRILDFQIRYDFNTDLMKSVWISERLMNNLGLTYEDVQNGPAGSIFAITGRSDYHFGGIIEDFRLVTRKTEASDPGRLVVITPDSQGLMYNIMEMSGERKEAKKALIDLNRKLAIEEPGSIIYGIPENCVYPEEFRDVAMLEQNRMMKTVRLFTIISILISILGMLGMSSYYANENTKSIAVHKIHGGTVRSETLRNIRTYMFLTAVACLFGVPLGLHVMKTYMTEYSFMDISYALPTAIAVTLTVCTSLLAVLWQTLRAARTNPVEALKKE